MKVVDMPEGKVPMAAALEILKRDLALVMEYHKLDAKIRRAKFQALVDEGFDKDQALELCKG